MTKVQPWQKAAKKLRDFINPQQLRVIINLTGEEEGQFFKDKIVEMAGIIDKMPKTGETDGKGDSAPVTLHYFTSDADWWIIEKDIGSADDEPGTGQAQAFGIADLGYEPELGYISLPELFSVHAELDLHFQPTTKGEILKRRN